jgi:hypothetical protein
MDDRQFQIWAYSVSHQSLLLRSPKAADKGSRIDVLFKGVARLHIPTTIVGMQIEAATIAPVAGTESFAQDLVRWNIVCAHETGFVDAVAVFAHEDELEFFDPSPMWAF